MSKKDIVLVSDDFYPNIGGISNYLWNLCTEVHTKKNLFVTVVTSVRSENGENSTFPIIRFSKKFNSKNLFLKVFNYISIFFQCLKIFYKQRKTLSCIVCGHIGTYPEILYLCSRIFKVPFISIIYAMEIKKTGHGFRKFITNIRLFFGIKRADYVITISNYTRNLILNVFPSAKVIIIPPGINLEAVVKDEIIEKEKNNFINKYDLKNKRILLSICRLVERKGIDTSLQAFKLLKDQYPDLVYIIGGEGPYRKKLEELVCNLEIKNRVIFLGNISDDSKIALYKMADLFIMTPRELKDGDVEGFGIVYLEANLYGKAVIGSNSGGISDAIEHEVSGLLVDSVDFENVAHNIDKLLSDTDLLELLGVKGRQRVLSEFNWNYLATKFCNLLNEL